MSDLSKQQLILLALLVSFVTSLATGIVTVSLMDQAPQGVTRTISQVIEKTIQQIAPQNSAALSMTIEGQTAAAVRIVSKSVVKLRSKNGSVIGGLGLIVSKDGVILSDKSAVAGLSDYEAVFPNGKSIPVTIVQSQNDGDIIFLAPLVAPSDIEFVPVKIGSSPYLGQTVFSLSGTATQILSQGIITEASVSPVADTLPIKTSISSSKVIIGTPLFDLTGIVMGMRTTSSGDKDGAEFYPIGQLQSVIPKGR